MSPKLKLYLSQNPRDELAWKASWMDQTWQCRDLCLPFQVSWPEKFLNLDCMTGTSLGHVPSPFLIDKNPVCKWHQRSSGGLLCRRALIALWRNESLPVIRTALICDKEAQRYRGSCFPQSHTASVGSQDNVFYCCCLRRVGCFL